MTTPLSTVSWSARHLQPLRAALDQQAPCFGRRIAQRDAAELNPGAAGGAALIARERRVAHDDFDAFERDVEFFGDHLRDGDIDTLAHVHLAEVRGDVAVGQHRNPRIELIGRQRRFAAGVLA